MVALAKSQMPLPDLQAGQISNLDEFFQVANSTDDEFKSEFNSLVQSSEHANAAIKERDDHNINIRGFGSIHSYEAYADHLKQGTDKLKALREIKLSLALTARRILLLVDKMTELCQGQVAVVSPDNGNLVSPDNVGTIFEKGYTHLKAETEDGVEVKIEFPGWNQNPLRGWRGSIALNKGPTWSEQKFNCVEGKIDTLIDMDYEKQLAAWDSPGGTRMLRLEADSGENRRMALHLAPDAIGRVKSKVVFRSSPIEPDDKLEAFRFHGNDVVAEPPEPSNQVLEMTGVNLGKLLARAESKPQSRLSGFFDRLLSQANNTEAALSN